MSNGKVEAAKPRIPKKRVLTAAEMRAKASYRAMERLLEGTIATEEQLWSISRVMSGEEFLAASEERCLAGMCGNALCSQVMPEIQSTGNFHIDSIEKKVYAAAEGPGYCGVDCAAASKSFAHRLGSGAQAMHRFERLMDQLREKKRKQRLLEEKSTTEASPIEEKTTETTADSLKIEQELTAPPSDGAAAQPVKPKGVLKKKSDLAAGSVKIPIMAAEVKERELPTEGVRAEPPKAPSARKTHAVEGYVPKAALKQHRKERKEGRRVRFSDAADGAEDVPENVKGATTAVGAATAAASPTTVASSKGCDISPSGYGWEEGEQVKEQVQEKVQEHVQPLNSNGQPAVFVLDVEDAESPIEGAKHALSSAFGRLRVANEEEVQQIGLPVQETIPQQHTNSNGDIINASSTATTNSSPPATTATPAPAAVTELSVDEILTERLRQGASKYFPQLAATLTPELAQTLEDTASEAGSSEAESDAEEWMLSDTDSDEELIELENGISGGNNGKYRARPTLFGQLVTNLDAWVTEYTVLLLQTGPDDTLQGNGNSVHFSPPLSSSSVLEIETALSRFISFALPPVMEKLAIDVPKGEVERNLMEFIKTLQLVTALPAFASAQWQLVVMVFLKALSMERVPGLRPVFETREGVHRLNKVLTANAFTIEEFVAVLEILLET